MKRFSLAVALGLLTASVAQAAPEYEVKGVARLRYEDTMTYGTAATSFSRPAFWSIRVRPSLAMKVDDHATVFIEPQFAKQLGALQTDTAGLQTSGNNQYNEYFHMHQGNIQLKFSDEFMLKGGRFIMDYGSSVILGKSDWGTYGRSWDGALLVYKNDMMQIDGAHLKLAATTTAIDSDKELAVLYTQWKVAEALKALDVYALYESDRQSGKNDNRNTFGGRVKAKFGDIDAGVEYAMEKASASYGIVDNTGSMVIAEAGYTFPDLMKLRLGLEYNQANEYWLEWYPTTKAVLGRNDVVSRRNLNSLAFRAKAQPSDVLTVNLDFWMFSRTSNSVSAFKSNGSAIGTAAGSRSEDIGNSIELSLGYKYTENVEYGVGFAYFTQGAYLKDQFGERTLTDGYAMVNVNF